MNEIRPGRPYALTLDVIAKIAAYVRMGFSLRKSAAALGLHENTLYNYKKDAEALAIGTKTRDDFEPEYVELLMTFFDSVLQAQAQGEIEAVAKYNELALQQKDLPAMFKMIQRQYGRGKAVDSPPVRSGVDVLDMNPDDLKELSSTELEELSARAKQRELAAGNEEENTDE